VGDNRFDARLNAFERRIVDGFRAMLQDSETRITTV
jgi:hypothetical protein